MQWQGSVDDANGIGVMGYLIYKQGGLLATSTSPTFLDTNIDSGQSVTYTIQAVDDHRNIGPGGNAVLIYARGHGRESDVRAPKRLTGNSRAESVANRKRPALRHASVVAPGVLRLRCAQFSRHDLATKPSRQCVYLITARL
jgi:hypothetical protein